jgi:hypothetical protein
VQEKRKKMMKKAFYIIKKGLPPPTLAPLPVNNTNRTMKGLLEVVEIQPTAKWYLSEA